MVFLAVVHLLVLQNLQAVLQNLVGIESFLTMMMMMMFHLVERLVLVLVMLVAELQGVVVVELHPH